VSDERCTLLICYDGSPAADHAAEAAGKLFPGARAHLLYVWEPVERIIARYAVLAPFMGEQVGAVDADVEAEAGRVAAAGVEIASRGGLEATPCTAQLQSTVWEAVLATAEKLAAGVIVTGTRSLHGVREVIANTLSHHLIQHSQRPVLAIPTPVPDSAS